MKRSPASQERLVSPTHCLRNACPALALLLALAAHLPSAEPRPVGVVSHVKVVSDKVEDVSSLEAWQSSFIKKDMTDLQKALAVWESVVKFRHQDVPPREFLQSHGGNVHDPIKTFNVYGYGMCSCASSNVTALARAIGLQARGWGIAGHSVPEVSANGKSWLMLDTSLINYFPRADGWPAGVEEIVAGVQEWLRRNPGLRKNDAKLLAFMRNGGWRKGPDVLRRCRFYDDNGWLPAATHGWYSTMQEYDCKPFIYEYGYSQGYRVNVQLRKGERLTRNWSNKGLHINMDGAGPAPGCLKTAVGSADLRYSPRYGDLAPGRIGNGTLTYDVPLAEGDLRLSALEMHNLTFRGKDRRGPAVHVKDRDKPGALVLRMPSSYVYLGGHLTVRPALSAPGRIVVSISDNNGLSWKEVATLTRAGERRIDLKPFVFRRYDYRLKFVLHGAGTGLDALKIDHDVQHSQRALPALGKGRNTITVSAGPPEGTITIEGSTSPDVKGKQLVYTDFRPAVEGLRQQPLCIAGAAGQITFPVTTPGDMVRLRFGGHYRARDARDGWDLLVSFDGGKTFTKVDRCAGPTPGSCRYVTFTDVPPRTRQALVRFAGNQRNTTCLFDFRIDADYREPHGGLRPIRVTYRWKEDGRPRQDVRVVRMGRETYTIACAGKPVMESVSVEWAE
jgi:hypothetical protein